MHAPDLLTSADDRIPAFEPSSDEDAGFAAYYEREVRPLFGALEADREDAVRRHRRRLVAVWPIGILLLIAYALFLVWQFRRPVTVDPRLVSSTMLLLALAIGLLAYYVLSPLRAYENEAHALVFPRILSFFGDLRYERRPAPDWSAVWQTAIVRVGSRNTAADRIYGTYKGTGIDLMELRTETGGKDSELLFQGLLVTATFPRPFRGRTIINAETGQSRLFAPAGGMETVELEDPEFERMFEVYSTDQVEARYLLTPDFMTDILHLAAVFGHEGPSITDLLHENLFANTAQRRHIRLSFTDNRLNIAIPSARDRFELPAVHRAADDYKAAVKAYREIKDVLAIVDILGLRRG